MTTNNVSFFDPSMELEAKRRRAFADAIMKQAQPSGNQMVGNIVVKQSPLEGLARALQQGLAGYESGQADKLDAQAKLDQQKRLADALTGIKTGDYAGVAQNLMQYPDTFDTGVSLLGKTIPNQGSTPAVIQLADEIEKARKGGNQQRVNDLILFGKTLEKGQGLDENGNIVTLSGASDSNRDLNYSKEAGKQQAQTDYAEDKSYNEAMGKGRGENVSKATETNQKLVGFVQTLQTAKQQVAPMKDSEMGPIMGRINSAAGDSDTVNLRSTLNIVTLQAKDMLNMPSANFSDADRTFLEDIAGGNYPKKATLGFVLDKLDGLGRQTYQNNQALIDSGGKQGAQMPTQSKYSEGQTARNPKTGETLVFKGGKWVKP